MNAVALDDPPYPTSDGKPMAESDLHRVLLVEVVRTLEGYFAARPDVYVSGNLMVFDEPGNRRRFLAPDCFVAFGVQKRVRDYYKVWEEGGRFPAVVFEFTSESTREEDLTHKRDRYRDVWRVDEYFLFDPRGEYLSPPLQGYRWLDGQFVPMEMLAGQFLVSEALGLMIEPHGRELVFVEADTHRRLYPPEQQALIDEARGRRAAEAAAARELAARELAEAAAARESAARQATEAENARLRAELAALREKS